MSAGTRSGVNCTRENVPPTTRAIALLRGRDYALPQDLLDIAPDILRHRLVLSYDALADDIPADHIVARIIASVPMPSVASRQGSPAAPTSPLPFDPHAQPAPPQYPQALPPHSQSNVWPGQQ